MEKKPVIEKDFTNDYIVICAQCRGQFPLDGEACTLCNGTGMLHRVVAGTVKLYTTN